MRLVKLGLISIVGLFIVIFLMSLLFPSQVRISRAINITAPKDSLVIYLADLRQWSQWNQLTNSPDISQPQYTKDRFTSNRLQVELESVAGDTILTRWSQEGGREIASGFTLHTSENTSVVQWYFDFRLKWYPWEKFGSIIFDKQLGPPMEQSLGALKKKLETTP